MNVTSLAGIGISSRTMGTDLSVRFCSCPRRRAWVIWGYIIKKYIYIHTHTHILLCIVYTHTISIYIYIYTCIRAPFLVNPRRAPRHCPCNLRLRHQVPRASICRAFGRSELAWFGFKALWGSGSAFQVQCFGILVWLLRVIVGLCVQRLGFSFGLSLFRLWEDVNHSRSDHRRVWS